MFAGPMQVLAIQCPKAEGTGQTGPSVRPHHLSIDRAADFRDQFEQRLRSIETEDRAGQCGKPCFVLCQTTALAIPDMIV
jgi:hypothetical protein